MGFAGILRRIQKDFGWGLHAAVILILCHVFVKSFTLGDSPEQLDAIGGIHRERDIAHGFEVPGTDFENKDLEQVQKSRKRKKNGTNRRNEIEFSQEEKENDAPQPPFISSEKIEKEIKTRFDHLKQQCSRLNLGLWKTDEQKNFTNSDHQAISSYPKIPVYQSLLLTEKLQVSYCPLKGAGEKWMSKRMLKLINISRFKIRVNKDNPLAFARSKFPYLSSWSKYSEIISNSVNILVVRNPFDRLIDAYRENFEDADFMSVDFKRYSTFIIRMYRSDSIIMNDDAGEFASSIPTFAEFCLFLIYQNVLPELDSWKPLVKQCSPCSIAFNTILDYNTLYQETSWAFKKKLNRPLMSSEYINYWITPEVRNKYFSTLNAEQVDQLYEKYKLDFDLFNFDMIDFRNYAKQMIKVDGTVQDFNHQNQIIKKVDSAQKNLVTDIKVSQNVQNENEMFKEKTMNINHKENADDIIKSDTDPSIQTGSVSNSSIGNQTSKDQMSKAELKENRQKVKENNDVTDREKLKEASLLEANVVSFPQDNNNELNVSYDENDYEGDDYYVDDNYNEYNSDNDYDYDEDNYDDNKKDDFQNNNQNDNTDNNKELQR